MIYKKTVFKFAVLAAVTLGIAGIFQNCSKVSMGADYGGTSLSVDGVFYTNQKIVPLKIKVDSTFDSTFDEIRISLDPAVAGAGTDWQPFAPQVDFDLGPEFSADHSKDGLKDIIVEVRQSANDHKVIKKTQQIFLDTMNPTLDRNGLLDVGLQGSPPFSKDQPVQLNWTANDPGLTPKQASGFDMEKGFRWGTSATNDCSEAGLTYDSGWISHRNTITVPWPQADPLDAFYFCMWGKDKAGNVGTLLSQPMTALWSVIVGDNSQGNGGSVTSNKVRFKTPHFLYKDPENNIYVKDDDFATWRKIRAVTAEDTSRTIETSLFPYAFAPVVYDAAGNAYYNTNGSISVLMKGTTVPRTLIQGGLGSTYIAVRNANSASPSLLIYHFNGADSTYIADSPTSQCYLFEVPLAKFTTASAPPVINFTTLLSTYKIAGNGTMANSSFSIPAEVIMSKTDSETDLKYSLSVPRCLTTGDNGDIFLCTITDGGGRGFGHQSIRRLAKQPDGTHKQTILSYENDVTRGAWISQLAYFKQGAKEFLVGSGSYSPMVIDLKTNAVSRPFAEFAKPPGLLGGGGVAVVPNSLGSYDIYLTVASSSQIYKYSSSFHLDEVFGREVHDNISDPLATVIANPNGLVQDPNNGDLYFVDSQNALINKVSKEGDHDRISWVTGQVQNYNTAAFYDHELLSNYILGSIHYNVGLYKTQITGDFSGGKKMLYFASEPGKIEALDANLGTVTTLLRPLAAGNVTEENKYYWNNSSLLLINGAAGQPNTLLVSKRFNNAKNLAWHADWVGFVGNLSVNGSTVLAKSSFLGDVTNSNVVSNGLTTANPVALLDNNKIAVSDYNQSIKTDAEKNIYISGLQFKISKLDSTRSQVLQLGTFDSFVVIDKDDAPGRKILIYLTPGAGANPLNIVELDSTKFLTAASPVVPNTAKKLCLPGTKLGGAYDLILDNDGNLIISDSRNGRILKYRIRTDDGDLRLYTTCPAGT